MERLTLILPITDIERGNVMASVVAGNPANMTTFDGMSLVTENDPQTITHCWMSTGVSEEEKQRLALSLALFPDAIFIFHTNDELMQVISSNSPAIMALQGQSLSPIEAVELLGLRRPDVSLV